MAIHILVKAAYVALLFASETMSQACVPRPAAELIVNGGFESGPDDWTGTRAPVATVPSYPSHSGNHMLVLSALYQKTSSNPADNRESYISQNVVATRTNNRSRVKFYYNTVRLNKGSICPDTSLPQASCKLVVSYAEQTLATIRISQTSGYVEFSKEFTPESSARYVQLYLTCKPTSETPSCGDVVVLVDDFSYYDLGHTCWTPLGCYTDSVSSRALPNHGRIVNWPYTTNIERCQEACGVQGYVFAGLEYGKECFCGNSLSNTSPATSGCNMPCADNALQTCGGANRLNVFRKP